LKKIALFFFIISTIKIGATLDDVPISNSVYDFLLRLESKGLMEHSTLSKLPLQRREIIDILRKINTSNSKIQFSKTEIEIARKYLADFGDGDYSVVFPSETDSEKVFFKHIFDNSNKLFYRYNSEKYYTEIRPLGSLDFMQKFSGDSSSNVGIGSLGVRLFGEISGHVGFFLQATNGRKILGDRSLAGYNPEYTKSLKFVKLGSDIDLSQSHLTYQNDWFRAKIGRQDEQVGAGLFQKTFISTMSPAFDEISLSAIFSKFRYSYSLGSILGYGENMYQTGFATKIPSKFIVQHSFTALPSWGEITFWEAVLFSNRGVDLAYLNPLSFLKTLEHQLHDRDNSVMGMQFVIRPVNNLQIKSSFLLDDIIFEKIGTGYWSNKTAFNIAAISSLDFNTDVGIEYSRVEPYTYSHFNYQTSYTNDSLLLGSYLLPNSEQYGLLLQYWWGEKFPVKFKLTYTQHGENITDPNGKLIRNVGGDPRWALRFPDPKTGFDGDSYQVKFLDGKLIRTVAAELNFGYEIFTNLYAFLNYKYSNCGCSQDHYLRFLLTFNEF
jgi:hypothetical protein